MHSNFTITIIAKYLTSILISIKHLTTKHEQKKQTTILSVFNICPQRSKLEIIQKIEKSTSIQQQNQRLISKARYLECGKNTQLKLVSQTQKWCLLEQKVKLLSLWINIILEHQKTHRNSVLSLKQSSIIVLIQN